VVLVVSDDLLGGGGSQQFRRCLLFLLGNGRRLQCMGELGWCWMFLVLVLSWQWQGVQGYLYSRRVNEWDCNAHGLLAEDFL
jgi:hypothetical protein